MPSRKQRRRRAKERRHEYEYVYVDDEGHEVEVDPAELKQEQKPKSNGRADRGGSKRGAAARGVRAVEPPSWRRVRRRALIVGPLMFIFFNFLSKNLTLAARITQTIVMLALFLPFSYLMDRTLYRAYLKRTGAGGSGPTARRR